MIRVRKETIYEKKNQIEKQNDKFKAHSANWRNFLGDFSTSKLRMQEGTLQCKVACFQDEVDKLVDSVVALNVQVGSCKDVDKWIRPRKLREHKTIEMIKCLHDGQSNLQHNR